MGERVWRWSFALLNLSLIATSEVPRFGIASVLGGTENCPEWTQNDFGAAELEEFLVTTTIHFIRERLQGLSLFPRVADAR